MKLFELAQHAVILYEKQTEQEKRRIIKKEKALFPKKKELFEFWLPLVDVLRNQFAGPSKEIMDTILVAKNQVKDGFFANCGIS